MEVLACLNGEIMPVEQARVPVWDRGFLFGDSVYEVWRMYRGRCWLEPEHLARLRRSLKELEFPPVDLERLMDRLHRHDRQERGPGRDRLCPNHPRRRARAHAFPDPPVPPTELIMVRPYDDGPTARLREAGAAMISHPDLRWKRCDVKSTNLLGNVLAMEAARRAGCQEAVLLDADGLVTEATHSSLIWVRDGRLEGTPEGHEILPGMTRQHILRLAADDRHPVCRHARHAGRAAGRRRGDPVRHDDRGAPGRADRRPDGRRGSARPDRTAARRRVRRGSTPAGWSTRICWHALSRGY